MTRRPACTTVVTRPTRLSSPVTATDCGAPTWITTVFAPASSTVPNGATSRWSVTETPEPTVDEAEGASREPAVAITTMMATASTPTTASGQALGPGASDRRTPGWWVNVIDEPPESSSRVLPPVAFG